MRSCAVPFRLRRCNRRNRRNNIVFIINYVAGVAGVAAVWGRGWKIAAPSVMEVGSEIAPRGLVTDSDYPRLDPIGFEPLREDCPVHLLAANIDIGGFIQVAEAV